MKFEKHIEIVADDSTAVDVLADETDLSRQVIKKTMLKGAVWLGRRKSTQRIRRASKLLKPGDRLHLYYDESVLARQPVKAVLVADEGDYSIWNKPYGMLSQGSKWGDHCAINRWVEKNLQPQRDAFVVHRLDRAATGLIIIAHKRKTAAYFSALFQKREVEKKYQAIVHGRFVADIKLDQPLDGKPATSIVRVLAYDDKLDQTIVEVSIDTGRKHQIRRHLSSAGHPVVGDRLYGEVSDKEERNLCLVSCYLAFASPVDGSKKVYTLPGFY